MPVAGGSNVPTSSLTPQLLVDYARTFPWTTPVVGLAGYNDQPAVSFADDITKKIMAKSNPWKWNAVAFPSLQTQPYQQDYPTSVSQNDLGWLQSGIIIDINSGAKPIPKSPINAVNNILPTMGVGRPQKFCWIPNAVAQTGSWPGANTIYKDPLVANGGGPGSNPLAAITDSNGNVQVVTSYGMTGVTEPDWPPDGAEAGTNTQDGSVTWTVQDPLGVALRLDALATPQSMVWQVNGLYQRKPPNITSLSQTLSPIPDDLSYLVKQGFLAYCTKQAKPENFPSEFAQWLADIQDAMGSSDREYQEFGFYPASPVQGGSGEGSGGSYGYPGWPGWS